MEPTGTVVSPLTREEIRGFLRRNGLLPDPGVIAGLAEITDLSTLEERYRRCPSGLEDPIIKRYREVLPGYLQTVRDVPTLEAQWARCPTLLREQVVSALREVLGETW